MRNGLIAVALMAGLSGCATLSLWQKSSMSGLVPGHVLGNVTPLGDGAELTLPATPNYPARFSAVQVVTAQHQNQRVTFQAVLELSADQADIVLTAPAGPRILGIHWTKAGIVEDRTLLAPGQLSGLNVLGDIFISQWPSAEVRKALPPGVELRETVSGRQVVRGDHVILGVETIDTTDAMTKQVLKHNDFDYTMTIVTERAG